jgi:enoyl-CoA hydratase/carnithine racemase
LCIRYIATAARSKFHEANARNFAETDQINIGDIKDTLYSLHGLNAPEIACQAGIMMVGGLVLAAGAIHVPGV